METCGLDIYKNKAKKLEEVYSLILDESITVGDQKLLLQLKAPADHPGHSLKHADVEVIGMSVSDSWTSEEVKKKIEETSTLVGKAPQYATTDNGTNLCKPIRELGLAHHRDISHSLGAFMRRVYEEDTEFKDFTKKMSETRKYSLTNLAYLMPPNQRSLARFMNLFEWVKWGKLMLENFHTFSAKERLMYSFIPAYASFIEELHGIMICYEQIMKICKQQGLSWEVKKICENIVCKSMMTGNIRMKKLGNYVLEYFRKEAELLDSQNDAHNISSDIIESTFGIFKDRKSPNKFHGITSFVLTIPLHTKISNLELAQTFQVKQRLERVKVKDVKDWAGKNLKQNLVTKRRQKFSFLSESIGTTN